MSSHKDIGISDRRLIVASTSPLPDPREFDASRTVPHGFRFLLRWPPGKFEWLRAVPDRFTHAAILRTVTGTKEPPTFTTWGRPASGRTSLGNARSWREKVLVRNERLRAVMASAGWTQVGLAEATGVDPKSVERWVSLGRVPRRATALRAAQVLGEDVHVLWPALRQTRAARPVSAELVALHDRRADVPVSTYVDLFAQARERIDVLVYAALFLHEAYPRLHELLRERAEAGCSVRLLLGDADHGNIQRRGLEERFGHGIESRCRLALMHCRPLIGVPRIAVRTHGTVPYNSLYRGDDQLLVNAHVWGVNAYAAPVWHLRRHDSGGLFDTYAESFDNVWHSAGPVTQEERCPAPSTTTIPARHDPTASS